MAEKKERELEEKRRHEEEQDRVRRATLEKLNQRPSLPPMNQKTKTSKADIRARKQSDGIHKDNDVSSD